MPVRSLVFSETSPSTNTTVASSQPVAGSDARVPAGVAGFNLDDFDSIDVYAILKQATGDTLDIFVQVSPDEGTTWIDAIHFPQLAAGSTSFQYRATLAAFQASTSNAPVVVGSGLTPLLAANTIVQGMGFDRARLVFKAGASTSAGSLQTVWMTGHRTRVRETGG